jgi:hypothetical protein
MIDKMITGVQPKLLFSIDENGKLQVDPMMDELSNIVSEYMLDNATIALRII